MRATFFPPRWLASSDNSRPCVPAVCVGADRICPNIFASLVRQSFCGDAACRVPYAACRLVTVGMFRCTAGAGSNFEGWPLGRKERVVLLLVVDFVSCCVGIINCAPKEAARNINDEQAVYVRHANLAIIVPYKMCILKVTVPLTLLKPHSRFSSIY